MEIKWSISSIQVHAFIVAHLHDNMPTMFGKEKTKAKLIANLQQTYTELSKAHGISPGDFPDVRKMQEMLKDTDFSKFQSLRESYLKKVIFTFKPILIGLKLSMELFFLGWNICKGSSLPLSINHFCAWLLDYIF